MCVAMEEQKFVKTISAIVYFVVLRLFKSIPDLGDGYCHIRMLLDDELKSALKT
jgi:hypothetical protein